MCLAVPAKVLEVDPSGWSATVEYMGSQIEVGTALVEAVRPGQYVLVHVGEAIQVIDEEQARTSIALWKEWLQKA